MPTKKNITIAAHLRTLSIVYWTQIMMLVFFSLVILFIGQAQEPADEEFITILQYMLLGLFIMGLVASRLVPNYLIRKIDPSLELKNKIPQYFKYLLIRAACLEIPGMCTCIIAFLTGRFYYLAVVPLLLIIFILYSPSKSTIAEDLNLSQAERDQLNDPNAFM